MYAKDTKLSDWLSWFTRDHDTSPIKQAFRLPGGRRVASDGSMAVVTTEDGQVVELSGDSKIPASILGFMALPFGAEVMFTLEQLTAMFGACEGVKVVTCPQCKGAKEVEHNCGCDLCNANFEECNFCDGKGVAEEIPEPRYRCVLGKPFDAERIAYILEHAPKSEEYRVSVRVAKVKKEDSWQIHIVTSTWHAIFVVLEGSVKREYDCPEVMEAKVTA